MFDLNIKTDRLTLRPFRLVEAPRVRALADNVEIARMVASIPHPYPDGLAEKWIGMHSERRASGKGYPFAIALEGEVVGSIGIEDGGDGAFELGYWLGQDYWGRGFVSEAAAALVTFAFGWLSRSHLRARFISDNLASGRILARLGFTSAGPQQPIFHKVRGENVELTPLILTRDVWAAKQV